MKGTKEFYDIVAQFEKDFRNGEFYVSASNPLKQSPKDSKSFYDNGMVNTVFNAYLSGYSFCKSLNN